MIKTDVLIIGGGPAGVISAITARKNYPSTKITLVRNKKVGVIPCGIPYIFYRLKSVDQDILPDEPLKKNEINLIIDEAKEIDFSSKKVVLKEEEIFYDKLILATGSKPSLLPIPGIEKEGVWLIKKDLDYLKKLKEAVMSSKDIVIIGGGFIGVEIAEDLSFFQNLNIAIVERSSHCLGGSFDEEFAKEIEKKLFSKGVKIFTNATVKEIKGEKKVEAVVLEDGKEIKADLVIVSVGARPDVDLAKKAGIRIGDYGGIWVDEYMRTSVPDVFAVGDCAETRDFFTGRHIPIMLASTATHEARIAGTNVYEMKILKKNKGTLASFCTFVGDRIFGVTGLTEKRALEGKFDFVVGESTCPDHHPASLPDTQKLKLKLIFSKASGRLLGAQLMGSQRCAEMVNLLGVLIQEEMTIYDLDFLQISTHPLITPAPTIYPVIVAAQQALSKIKR